MCSGTIYYISNTLYLYPYCKTPSGRQVMSEPFIAVSASETDAAIGAVLLDTLERSRVQVQSDELSPKLLSKKFAKYAGFSNWKALATDAIIIEMVRRDDKIELIVGVKYASQGSVSFPLNTKRICLPDAEAIGAELKSIVNSSVLASSSSESS